MITKDIIKANGILSGLTDEQVLAIETLSRNDEEATIGARISEIYTSLDRTIAEHTGIARNGDEKTYKYLERAVKTVRDTAGTAESEYKRQIADLTAEKQRLEKIVNEGSHDSELSKQLSSVRAELDATKDQYNRVRADMDKAKAAHAKELRNVRIDYDLDAAMGSVKLKGDLPEGVRTLVMQQAVSRLKSYNPDYVDDGQGGRRLVFHTETGAVMNNPEDQLNPYTASTLLAKELRTMGVLDEGRQQTGAGSGSSGGSSGGTMSLSGARTRTEAQEIIAQSLMQRGLVKGSEEYQTAMDAAWADNNVSALPMQ